MRKGILLLVISVLATCLAAARDKVENWIEVRSPHFRVLTNGSQGDARDVAKEFEQLRHLFAEQYPEFRLEGGAPLVIFAALDESSAKSLEPGMWKAKGAKPAGVFQKLATRVALCIIRLLHHSSLHSV